MNRLELMEKTQADALNAKRFRFMLEHFVSLGIFEADETSAEDGHLHVLVKRLGIFRCEACGRKPTCNVDEIRSLIDQSMKEERFEE